MPLNITGSSSWNYGQALPGASGYNVVWQTTSSNATYSSAAPLLKV